MHWSVIHYQVTLGDFLGVVLKCLLGCSKSHIIVCIKASNQYGREMQMYADSKYKRDCGSTFVLEYSLEG